MRLNKYNFLHNKYGFTLAEVLITLVIIGVVAALTVSPIINTYVESSTVAKVKKGLSILGQAKKLAEVQNGSIEGWDFGEGATAETASQFWNYLKPHISVIKDCGSNSGCYQNNGVHLLNGDFYNGYIDSSRYKFILADGSVMWFRMGFSGKCASSENEITNVCAVFSHDVNGDKAPNIWGRDIFSYAMTVNGIYPLTHNDCNKNSSGWGCAGYIIKHNNMKYLH